VVLETRGVQKRGVQASALQPQTAGDKAQDPDWEPVQTVAEKTRASTEKMKLELRADDLSKQSYDFWPESLQRASKLHWMAASAPHLRKWAVVAARSRPVFAGLDNGRVG
jgi:hypothetical protein